jgi:hypothetical protein
LRNPSPGSASFFPPIPADRGVDVDAAAGFSPVAPSELMAGVVDIEDAMGVDERGEAAAA